jgi:DNA polymerase-1
MVKVALIYIDKALKESGLDASLINVVHDEIVVEASETDAEGASKILQECMERAGREIAPGVPWVTAVNIGDDWKH